jgi:DNA primase
MIGEWVDFGAVKASVSLAQVLRAYQVDWLRSRRPGQWEGRCPIHRGARSDAFQVNLTKNAFHYFACQSHGNVLDFVAAMEGCCLREAARRLACRFQVSTGSPSRGPVVGAEKGNWLGETERGNRPLGFTLRGIDSSHPYLTSRGITRQTATWFGAGFYLGSGIMRGRMVIPIHDSQGRLVAYAGRSLDGRPPKYRLPVGFRKSEVLFNWHRVAGLGQRTVVIVEGYLDCMKVHQAGFPSVVALMGTVLSPVPESLLLEGFSRIVLMLDGDASGQQATERIARQLAGRGSVRIAYVPAGQQPDQLNEKEIGALLDASIAEL